MLVELGSRGRIADPALSSCTALALHLHKERKKERKKEKRVGEGASVSKEVLKDGERAEGAGLQCRKHLKQEPVRRLHLA